MLAVGLLSASQAQALDLPFKLRVGADENGPFKPTTKIHMNQGNVGYAYWQLRSTDDADRGINFSTPSAPYDEYRVRWFKGNKDITDDVEGDGLEVTLKAHADKIFRSRVKRVEDSSEETCIGANAFDGFDTSHAELGVNQECVI